MGRITECFICRENLSSHTTVPSMPQQLSQQTVLVWFART